MRIGVRLTLILVATTTVVVVAYGYLRILQQREQFFAEKEKEVSVLSTAIRVAAETAIRDGRFTDLRTLLAQIVAEDPLISRIRIFDRQLRPLFADDPGRLEDPVDQDRLAQVATADRPISFLASAGRQRLLHHLVPLHGRGGRSLGVLEVVRPLPLVERELRALTAEIIVRVGLLSVALGGVILWVVRGSILRPVRRLMQGVVSLGRGELGARIPVERRDELGRLAAAFNDMSASLERARADLLREAAERRELERRIQQAQKLAAVGALASEVAHEIGTPLNVISGRAEVLQEALEGEERLAKHLGIIIGQIERISGIIRRLLDFARPPKPQLQALDLNRAARAVLDFLEAEARGKGVQVQAQLHSALPTAAADPDLIQQLLLNVLTNALDATPGGGRIVIRTRAVGEGDGGEGPDRAAADSIVRGKVETPAVEVSVADTGSGIPADILPRVFEPFFSTKGTGLGTGLGLPIVEDIVRAHRGEVEVRSRAGEGSTVAIRLPAYEGAGSPGIP